MPETNKQNIQKVVTGLVKALTPRNRDIVLRRFGLKNGQHETLEAIGQSYGITRERVRQIENYIVKNLKAELPAQLSAVRPYYDFVGKALKDNGGWLSEQALFTEFSGAAQPNTANRALAFLLSLNEEFVFSEETDERQAFYALDNESVAKAEKVIAATEELFKKEQRSLPQAELVEKINLANSLSEKEYLAALAISKTVSKNIFGEYGLSHWPEIKPKGVRDRAFLVLKREAKPKHFREIASLINTANFSNKKANIQTVHNELIKDGRFVLVGRGIYGLSEWGYRAGTVKDVLVNILKQNGKPLGKAELISKVLDSRLVKENTILLNLQDGKTFVRKGDGSYTLKEA